MFACLLAMLQTMKLLQLVRNVVCKSHLEWSMAEEGSGPRLEAGIRPLLDGRRLECARLRQLVSVTRSVRLSTAQRIASYRLKA